MNLGQLERYAPKARIDFIQAVTAKASKLGISKKEILEARKSGDALIIGSNVYPVNIDFKRKALIERVEKEGYDKVMEEAAYTWFNRFTAIRYMEIHGYIEEHPFSLFEGSDGSSEPEIIKHVADLGDWEELNFNLALDLKTQNKTEELYQLIITAQCHSLGKVIPFLFALDSVEIELLLPEGIQLSDSIIKEMIAALNVENLSEVESLGWLYQFYISEKKDTLMKAKKAYKADEIPAVTQLFTPNWIVKYLTQNSIGRLWLSTYPSSLLKEKMEYYIEPAKQSEEVENQLEEIKPKSLNPEELTILDPACGSGHILIEAYNLLKEIYLERGYQENEIPRLILENNLFGLDIDDRAAQLARFSLLMRARQDDKRLLRAKKLATLHVHSIQETNDIHIDEFKGLRIELLDLLLTTFENAKTYGSLIMVPESLKKHFKELSTSMSIILSEREQTFGNLSIRRLIPVIQQTETMMNKYDVVVTNPPYLGGGKLTSLLKEYLKESFPNSKTDLFSSFIENGFNYTKSLGYNALITMQSWMFLPTFENMRKLILNNNTIITMAHLGSKAFGTISGDVVQTTAFVLKRTKIREWKPKFFRLTEGNEQQKAEKLKNNFGCFNQATQNDFSKIPGSPIVYWASESMISTFKFPKFSDFTFGEGKNITSDNNRFLRNCWEVDQSKLGRGHKWLPYAKGGNYKKWYGNLEHVVNWSQEARDFYKKHNSGRIIPEELWYLEGITWTPVATAGTGFRYLPPNTTFDTKGLAVFIKDNEMLKPLLGLLNSVYAKTVLNMINPTIMVNLINLNALPIAIDTKDGFTQIERLIEISKEDWDSIEISLDFSAHPLINPKNKKPTIQDSYKVLQKRWYQTIQEANVLEERNNESIIKKYSLEGELSSRVSLSDITLHCNTHYRYKGRNDIESKMALETDTIKELISYSVGCMMGRYCLDEPGLIYAQSKNTGFDKSKYKIFPVDDDGIITLSDIEDLVIRDDLTDRFTEFVQAVYGEKTLSENIKFVADSLGLKNNELPKETIRRWISAEFYKDHLQRYKNRPIYWLFSSGKKKAFEALVYLHRYNEGTLSRMRMKYVVPLQSRISDRLKTIEDDIASATSAQERNKLTRLKKVLADKELELREYDETLRHLAEQQIKLDLDDGVKVNYSKFPGLLAETKKVCGA